MTRRAELEKKKATDWLFVMRFVKCTAVFFHHHECLTTVHLSATLRTWTVMTTQ